MKKDLACLIIDDCEDSRYILKRMIGDVCDHANIIEKEDGKDAFTFLEQRISKAIAQNSDLEPMILFLDINMPVMSGFEFLEAYKELEQKHQLKSNLIFMFSSSKNQNDIERAMSHNSVKDYLVKGNIDLNSLIKLRDKYLTDNCSIV